MTTHFDTSQPTTRYAAWRAHHFLSSRVVVGAACLASLVTAMGFLMSWLMPSFLWWGITLVGGSLTAGLLLMVTFAATYFPFRHAKAGGHSEKTNVVERADFSLLALLGPYARQQTSESVQAGLLALLTSNTIQPFLRRLELKPPELQHAAQPLLVNYSWDHLAEDARALAASFGQRDIVPEHAAAAVLLLPRLKGFLRAHDLQEQDIRFMAWWSTALRLAQRQRARWWDPERLLNFTGIGLSWTSGFTPLVDRFIHFPAGEIWDHITAGREEQIEQLIATVARQRQSNVLLVGQPGTGRLGVALEMARRVRTGKAHPAINGQRVIYLHIGQVLARGESTAQQLAVISAALTEMERAGNIIAVIDGMGSILGHGEGRINLSDVLLPFFSSLTVRVVVIISNEEYHLRLKYNEELAHYFEVVQMTPLSSEQALGILALAAPIVEEQTGIFLPYKTLRAITEDTDGILPQTPYPERAFDVLEEAVVLAQQQELTVLSMEHIHGIVARKVGIPVGQINKAEKENLLRLEDQLHERVVNQTPALTAVARALIRARTGVRNKDRPIATFLFLGPTGVGKTETAKTLAATYFGSEDHMIRFDMSEFQSASGVEQLLGSLSHPVGRLTSTVSDRPFTVLLLDEFEKAHLSIQQLFLQIFDEGHVTDVRGGVVSFKHAIIIATSNAGAEFIRQAVRQGPLPASFNEQLRDHVLTQQIFKPELLNRFDGVITFTPLTPDQIREVARRMLKKLNKRLDAEHGITVAVTEDLLNYLQQTGYHPEFGARPMTRAIQDTVEYAVAQKVLRGVLLPGQELVLPQAELEQYRTIPQG